MDKTAIAKRICERYGISWNESLTVPRFQGEVYTPNMISEAFMAEQDKGSFFIVKMIDSEDHVFSNYGMKTQTLLVA